MLPQLLLVEDDFLATIRKVSRDGYCRLHVDPSDAKSLLERNTNNRKLRETVVDYYANEMINGNWVDNGDPIRIARSGRLLNGQHRLSAVVKAGVSLPFHFLSNLSEESFERMDNGVGRTVSDNLCISPSYSAVFKVIYVLKNYDKFYAFQGGQRKVGPSQIKSVMTDEILQVLEEIPKTKRIQVTSSYVTAVTVFCILAGYPKERIYGRYHNIITMTPTNPLEVAFNRWVTNLTQGNKLGHSALGEKMLPAFYKFYMIGDPESVQLFKVLETEAKVLIQNLHNRLTKYYQ